MRIALVLDDQRARAATHLVAAADARLGALEVGQHVGPRPAAAAELRPGVVVGRLAADIEMAVDRARSAENLAPWEFYLAAIDVRTGRGLVAPVEALVVDRLVEAGRHLDPDVVVVAASLDHRDAVLARLGEAIGQYAARGTRAHDHIIEFFHFCFLLLVVLSVAKDLAERSDADSQVGARSFAALRMTCRFRPPRPTSMPTAAPTSPSPWRPACRSCGSPRSRPRPP